MLVGVVGKPNVGKSTFFKALTLADVEIANYPFATIKPNEGVGFVSFPCSDKFFDTQCHPRTGFCEHHTRFVPVQVIDVAGLVPGAHEGKGLGNQFLDDLRQADVLIHVIDLSGSTNEKGESVDPGAYDPLNDVQFLEDELDYWYVGILKKGWEKFARVLTQEKRDVEPALAKQLSGLKVTEDQIVDAIKQLELNREKPLEWTPEQLFALAQHLRKQTKPMVIACNKADMSAAQENFKRLQEKFANHTFVACSAESELALKEAAKHKLIGYVPGENTFESIEGSSLNEKQQAALNFIKTNILEKYGSTGVQQVINAAVFDVLKYMAIYPGGVNKLADKDGNVLPDCFLLPGDSTALDFAYKLHTDFGKNFIRAVDVKTKMTVGKDHPLKQGDVLEIYSGK